MATEPEKTPSRAPEHQRFVCVHCGHRWQEATEKPSRCPSCLRRTGVEPVVSESESATPAWFWPALIIGALALAGLGYVYWAQRAASTVGDEVPFEPLEASVVRGHLRRANVEEEDKVVAALGISEALREWAEQTAAGKESATAKADALLAALQDAKRSGKLVSWTMSRPRGTPVHSSDNVLRALREGEGARLYSLELALLMSRALRALGVEAMLGEVYALPDATRPPDPSGDLGYFVVLLPEGATPSVYDPAAGRSYETLPEADIRPVNDVNTAGAFLNHLGRHALVNEGKFDQALRCLEAAIKLDPRSPAIRSSRADVLVVMGGAQRALQEYQFAAQLRSDPPRRNNLAAIFMELRQHDKASKEVTAALEETPDYAAAILTLAALTLADGDTATARSHLDRVTELDSELPQLPLLWAQYFLETHDQVRAVEKADQAIEAQPYDINTAMGAAMVYRYAAEYDKMRQQARKILSLAPESQRAVYEAVLPRRLGPTALEAPDEAGDDPENDLDALPSAELQLDEGSSLLGGGASDLSLGEGASLLGDDGLLGGEESRPAAGDPTLRLGDPGGYRLSDDFMLQLGE